MSNIIFIGDSFCNAYQYRTGRIHRPWQEPTTDSTYLDFVADYFNLTACSYGFGGQSWYHSRCEFLKDISKSPDLLDKTDLVVFCHTTPIRLNTGTNTPGGRCGVHLLPDTVEHLHPRNKSSQEQLEVSKALGMWQVYLMDIDFQNWAQIKWFEEIHTLFAEKKMIHFSCFPCADTQKEFERLPGMVYRTPLVHISLGEKIGTDEEVGQSHWQETRKNHLSVTNNRALADVIIDSFKNYMPGCYDIDLSKFEILNPNASRWPNPGFGTQ
jgi:hypothetical protein